MRSKGLFECFLFIFDLENTILGLFPGVFKPRFGYRVRGSNFKSHSNILKPISDCSVRWAELNGTNIFPIGPSYHKLRLKTVQKCQKYGVLDRKAYFFHLFLRITSQFFHIIIYESCSFYSYKKIGNWIRPIDRKSGSKSYLKISKVRNFELDLQIIYHSIEHGKLSNFCENTLMKFPFRNEIFRKNWKIRYCFKNLFLTIGVL